jgi:hypothetical protein
MVKTQYRKAVQAAIPVPYFSAHGGAKTREPFARQQTKIVDAQEARAEERYPMSAKLRSR